MEKPALRPFISFSLLELIVLVVFIGLLAAMLLPIEDGRNAARIAITKVELEKLAAALRQHVNTAENPTNLAWQPVHQAIFSAHEYPVNRTNLQGEILDPWKTPYRISITPQTNFTIRSAGKNHSFGDKDDIVFNSTSNEFVKP